MYQSFRAYIISNIAVKRSKKPLLYGNPPIFRMSNKRRINSTAPVRRQPHHSLRKGLAMGVGPFLIQRKKTGPLRAGFSLRILVDLKLTL
ncbi:hypothetical protein SAMN05444358_102194 [Ruegeria halocynthiae]|uniref:Uncharacterized protein n=1 Tax=Ruegeria halocynthiae TaxID=985054 RepID=A0A1H2Y861_9RHOB|nr:hypothetical protein SAMN05444358_102194 [Ruegeria halocynthiae]